MLEHCGISVFGTLWLRTGQENLSYYIIVTTRESQCFRLDRILVSNLGQ